MTEVTGEQLFRNPSVDRGVSSPSHSPQVTRTLFRHPPAWSMWPLNLSGFCRPTPFRENWLCLAQSAYFKANPMFSALRFPRHRPRSLPENWLCLALSAGFQPASMFSIRWALFGIFPAGPTRPGQLALFVQIDAVQDRS